MPLLAVAGANAALNGLDGTGNTNTMGFGSLHTASPGTSTATAAANENANSGSYARLAATYNAASSSAKTNASSETYTTGGTVQVTHTGRWNSGTYGGGAYSVGAALASGITAVTIVIASGGLSLAAS